MTSRINSPIKWSHIVGSKSLWTASLYNPAYCFAMTSTLPRSCPMPPILLRWFDYGNWSSAPAECQQCTGGSNTRIGVLMGYHHPSSSKTASTVSYSSRESINTSHTIIGHGMSNPQLAWNGGAFLQSAPSCPGRDVWLWIPPPDAVLLVSPAQWTASKQLGKGLVGALIVDEA